MFVWFPQVLVYRPKGKRAVLFRLYSGSRVPILTESARLESLHKIRNWKSFQHKTNGGSALAQRICSAEKEYIRDRHRYPDRGRRIDSQGSQCGQMPASSGSHMDWMAIPSSCRLAAKRVWGCGMFQRTLRELRSASAETSGMKRVVSQRHRT